MDQVQKRLKVLLSNDDGINAPGLYALIKNLSQVADVTVVAPQAECSGYGGAVNIHRPLRVQSYDPVFGCSRFAVEGTPSDCIFMAMYELCKNDSFDIVITGINSGANLGTDLIHSGTFSAAATAKTHGIPAIATSLVGASDKSKNHAANFDLAASYITSLLSSAKFVNNVLSNKTSVLNINIPNVGDGEKIKGLKNTKLANLDLEEPFYKVTDPRGNDAYWLSLKKMTSSDKKDQIITDIQAVNDGFISLTWVELFNSDVQALEPITQHLNEQLQLS